MLTFANESSGGGTAGGANRGAPHTPRSAGACSSPSRSRPATSRRSSRACSPCTGPPTSVPARRWSSTNCASTRHSRSYSRSATSRRGSVLGARDRELRLQTQTHGLPGQQRLHPHRQRLRGAARSGDRPSASGVGCPAGAPRRKRSTPPLRAARAAGRRRWGRSATSRRGARPSGCASSPPWPGRSSRSPSSAPRRGVEGPRIHRLLLTACSTTATPSHRELYPKDAHGCRCMFTVF